MAERRPRTISIKPEALKTFRPGDREPTRQFVATILEAFPDWAGTFETYEIAEPDEDAWFGVAPPNHPGHRLSVVMRGNSAEVRYDDGEPPGPAEKLFVDMDREPVAVADAAIAFIHDLMNNRILVVRERLGVITRFIRRDRAQSVPSFRQSSELQNRKPGTFVAIYEWK